MASYSPSGDPKKDLPASGYGPQPYPFLPHSKVPDIQQRVHAKEITLAIEQSAREGTKHRGCWMMPNLVQGKH